MLGSPFAAMGLANLAQQFGSGGDFEELYNCCYSPGLDDISHLCLVNNWKLQQVVYLQQQVWQALEAIRASPAALL